MENFIVEAMNSSLSKTSHFTSGSKPAGRRTNGVLPTASRMLALMGCSSEIGVTSTSLFYAFASDVSARLALLKSELHVC